MKRSAWTAVVGMMCAGSAWAQVFGGLDPVALASGERVDGDAEITLVTGGQTVRFANDAARERWLMDEGQLAPKANEAWLMDGGDESEVLAFALARRPGEYNVGNGRVGVSGYDPVAYFPEGGGEPRKGNSDITQEYDGVVYEFASESNRDRFTMNPTRYEPAYGGWCAWAMANGDTVEVDPKQYVLTDDGRLLLFYKDFFTNTRKKWEKAKTDRAPDADANWSKKTGEPARSSD